MSAAKVMHEMRDAKGAFGALEALRAGAPFVSERYQIVTHYIHDRQVSFAVDAPEDTVQGHHLKGEFYEAEELEIIRRAFRPGDVFADVGTNVGNHSLYVGLYLHPAKIIPVEPNPKAVDILLANLTMNGLGSVLDLDALGFGLSDAPADDMRMRWAQTNLGGAKLKPGGGTLKVTTGDLLFADKHVDFIKMDVEGMELAALRGLEGTIARDAPTLFVEVSTTHQADFEAWVAAQSYEITERFKRYGPNENFLIQPKDGRRK